LRISDCRFRIGAVSNPQSQTRNPQFSILAGNEVKIVQQNPGPTAKSRATFSIESQGEKWKINNDRIVGWLRKE